MTCLSSHHISIVTSHVYHHMTFLLSHISIVTSHVYNHMTCLLSHHISIVTSYIYCHIQCLPSHDMSSITSYIYCHVPCLPSHDMSTIACSSCRLSCVVVVVEICGTVHLQITLSYFIVLGGGLCWGFGV